MKRIISLSISFLLVFSLVVGGLSTLNIQATNPSIEELIEEALNESRVKAEQIQRDSLIDKAVTFNVEDQIELMLLLEDGSSELTSEQKSEIMNQTVEALKAIPTVTIGRQYSDLIFGLSISVQYQYYEQVKQIETIKIVRLSNQYMPSVSDSKSLTQSDIVLEDYGMTGAGVVVAIIDSGIDPTHKDMVLTDPNLAKLNETKVQQIIASGALNADPSLASYKTAKVPFGYNYADKNGESRDLVSPNSEHGMHVAGIVSANGNEAGVANGTSVIGLAPESQVLAMKVFPNSTEISSAKTEDIVAAIEDAVALGADVINLSLGSPAGFQDSTDIEQLVVQRATEAGVVVVISAGNSSFASKGIYDPTIKDESTAGSPATSTDAIMVANFEGTSVVTDGAQFCSFQFDGQSGCTSYVFTDSSIQFEQGVDYETVDGGLGYATDLTGVAGKVALIKRGDISFAEKVLNAQNAGAVGVIVYNHEAGGETLVNMALDPATTIPAIFVGNFGGQSAVDSANNPIYVSTPFRLLDGKLTRPNPNAGRFDDSTSWGTTPNLSFKPEIAAPGGDIYSTVNGDKYTSMSGTSMAAPHVSGAVALVIQKIKQDHPGITGKDLSNLVKNLMMNTASVVEDQDYPGVPYSPRRQGAGLLQTERMMLENSTITSPVNNKAAVELGMMTQNQVSFQLDVSNYGTTTQNYVFTGATILTGASDFSLVDGQPYDVVLPNSSIQSTEPSISVASGAKGTFNMNLMLPSTPIEGYVEGFMTFTVDGRVLTVPFIGYYGDFGKLPMFTSPLWAEDQTEYDYYDNGSLKSVGLYYNPETAGFYYLGADPTTLAISPNDDGLADNFIPATYMIRNAKTVDAKLYNEQGALVQDIATVHDVRRQIFAEESTPISNLIGLNTMWFGLNEQDQPLVEGHYKYVLEGSSDLPNASKQTLEFPIMLDLTAPAITFIGATSGASEHLPNVLVTNQDTYQLVWEATDGLSGLNGFMLFVNGELAETPIYFNDTTNQFMAEVPVGTDYNVIVLASIDNAMNADYQPVVVKRANYDAPILTLDVNFTNGLMVVNENHVGNDVVVAYGTEKEIGSIKLNGTEQLSEISSYSTNGELRIDKKQLTQGFNQFSVEAYDIASSPALIQPSGTTTLYETPFKTQILFDTQAPTIKGYKVKNLGNGEVEVTATVGDTSKYYQVYVNQTEIANVTTVDTTTITYKLKATEGQAIELKVVDLTGKSAIEKTTVSASSLPETGLSNQTYLVATMSILVGIVLLKKRKELA